MNFAKTVKALLTPISVMVAAIGGCYLVNNLAGSLDMESRIAIGLLPGLVIGSIGCTAFGAVLLYGAKLQTDDDPLVSLNLDVWLYGLTTLPLRWVAFKLGSSVLIICGILSYSDPKWYPASGFCSRHVRLCMRHAASCSKKGHQAVARNHVSFSET